MNQNKGAVHAARRARTVQLKTANDDEVCFGVENEGEVEMWCGILWCLGDLAVRRKGGSKSKR